MEVVASFEKSDKTTSRYQVHRFGSQVCEVARGEPKIRQRIGAMSVKAGGDQQPFRGEFLGQWRDDVVERQTIGVACSAGRKRQIDRRTHPRARADFAQ